MSEVGWKAVSLGLVRAFDVPQSTMGAFDGKMRGLQRQGVLGVMPGKGTALRYTPELMNRLVCTGELIEFGLTPANVLWLVVECWDGYLRAICEEAAQAASRKPGPSDVIMYIAGVRMATGGSVDYLPKVQSCSLKELPSQITRHLTQDPRFIYPGMPPTRMLATNLSERLRVFYAGVEEQLEWDSKKGRSRPNPLGARPARKRRA